MIGLPTTTRIAALVFAGLLVVAGGTGTTVAQSGQAEWAGDLYDEFDAMVPAYNDAVDPEDYGPLAGQLRGERVNMVVTDGDGSQATASFRLDDELRIQDQRPEHRSDATLKLSTDRETMTDILDSETPATAFQTAVADGDISIDGVGPVNAVKWFLINVVADLLR
ncbi:hypothetical protein ACFQL1_16580 [Halomicroarcula sp. GCM10025709]|uniref:hypothetical protein n=1 Tax=Haloarcula TaxID=2237 RepID=UPI0024C30821|nr:hypothetical protein [Halomicroarcula sp. YJ-61-S]